MQQNYAPHNAHIKHSQVVGNEAFNHCRELREVVIPEGVEELGAWAFNHCDALEKIHLPASLVKLDKKNQPFNNCYGLKEISVDQFGTTLKGTDTYFFNTFWQGNFF